MSRDFFDGFVRQYREEQDRLRQQLFSYEPRGVMRVWEGRALDGAREVTAQRVAEIEQQIARIEATIEFAHALQKAL
jgi:hypothetical protein